MADFGLIESFGVDDGELDGLSLQECFVLGYEFATITSRVDNGETEFETLIHMSNAVRLERALQEREVSTRLAFCHDDKSETWAILKVGEINE